MKTYVILLRGINVGGKNKLPMKELKFLLEGVGLVDVQTYIQSGNVVCRGDACDAVEIGRAIGDAHGFTPEVMVIEADAFLNMAKQVPYDVSEGKLVHLFFANEKIKPDEAKLEKYGEGSEEYMVTGKVCYLYAPDGIGRSKLAVNMERCLRVPVTARNWNTVQTLLDMLGDDSR